MTLLRLSRVHYPVTVLGPGRRVGIWLQGCSIGCAGCVSRDTWDPGGGAAVPIDDLLAWCKAVGADGGLDGLTISGGEPFEQPGALLTLLQALDAWRSADGLDFDVFCYSGMPYRRLRRRFAAQLALIDLLCPEPFVQRTPAPALWRGSPNQPLLPLTPRGRRMLEGQHAAEPGHGFQVDVQDGRAWFIGIPARGDMSRLHALAASRGLTLEGLSWTP